MKTLVLDMGNVIAYFDHRAACRQLAALATNGIDEPRLYDAIFKTTLEEEFDCGLISPDQFIAALRAATASTAPDEALARAWCDIFRLNDDVTAQLPAIAASPIRLVLASSTNALHFQWMTSRYPAVFAGFDEFVVSFTVGARKPAAEFFRAVLAAAGAPARECLYIDDRPDYVHAARAVGMGGAVYGPGSRFAGMLEASGVRALPGG